MIRLLMCVTMSLVFLFTAVTYGEELNESVKESNDVSSERVEPTEFCVLIEAGEGAGSGFICRLNGTNYIITNTHVIERAKKFKFQLVNGRILTPVRLWLADDRDLAMILVKEQDIKACGISGDLVKIGDPVFIYGNSEGMKVVTKLQGKIEAVGADILETSAEFVEGNSGSPMLNKKDDVIGVATYVVVSNAERWGKKDSADNKNSKDGEKSSEQKVRRFAVRFNDRIKWVPVSFENLYKQSLILNDIDLFLSDNWNIGIAISFLNSDDRERILKALKYFEDCVSGRGIEDYADQEYRSQIITLSRNVVRVFERMDKGFNSRSSSVKASIRNFNFRYKGFSVIPLKKIARVKWSTKCFNDRADEYQRICEEWKSNK
ncbi:trypsin-like peptidase domain-containing protein [Verrucomicrobiota bacterium]